MINTPCTSPRYESSRFMKFYRLFRGKENPTDKDALLLTPFHLYKKYHHFPLKVTLHLFLVVFISINALVLSGEYTSYGRANEQTFEAIFLPDSTRFDGIYNVPDTLDLISKTVINYYAFPAVSVKRYAHILVDNDETDGIYNIQPAKMTILSYKSLDGSFWRLPCPIGRNESVSETDYSEYTSSSSDDSDFLLSSAMNSLISDVKASYVENESPLDDDFDANDVAGDFTAVENNYNLTLEDPLGPLALPLSTCQLQHLFYKITEIHVEFSYRAMNVGLAIIPYFWDIELVLTLIGGQVQPTIIITHRIANVIGFSSGDMLSIMNYVLFLLSSTSCILGILSCVKSIRIFLRTKNRYQYYQSAARPGDHFPSWHCIPFRVKPRFFSFWSAFNSVGCLLLMASCMAGELEQWGKATSAWYLTLYGIGCILTSVNLLRYFEYFPLLYLHVQTLRNASIHVVTYCISVMPMYWAFVIFGVLNFGPYSEKFSSVGQTIITLFSLLNGDDIYATFQEIEEGQYPVPLVSRLYIISFVTIFVTSVLNVFIFIIEDSYRTAKLSSISRVGPWNSSVVDNVEVNDQQFTSREILQIIFHNLEVWEERMTQFPVVYGIEPDPHLDSFLNASYDDNDNESDDPYSILLEEFGDDSEPIPSEEIENEEIGSQTPIQSARQRFAKRSSSQNIIVPVVENYEEWQNLLEGLKGQIQTNRKSFQTELQKREDDIKILRQQYTEQEAHILEICDALSTFPMKHGRKQ